MEMTAYTPAQDGYFMLACSYQGVDYFLGNLYEDIVKEPHDFIFGYRVNAIRPEPPAMAILTIVVCV
jgi:hypothetical protein